jgi:hypothetical protein
MSLETFLPSSSNLDECTYNKDTQDLTIAFKSGASWVYHSVPQSVWFGLQHAPGAGSYFYRQIRNVFAGEEI